MKVKVSEVKDIALDWLVAKCNGVKVERLRTADRVLNHLIYVSLTEAREAGDCQYRPRRSWAQGGPIIEREKIKISPNLGDSWSAQIHHKKGALVGWTSSTGPTPLIAAMRCYVVSEMGEEVEIPEELL